MGHTLPTITDGFHRFLSHLVPFRRALRRADQLALDALIADADQHLPAASYAANLVPGVSFLLCMILEKHKQLERHEVEFEKIRAELSAELDRMRKEIMLQAGKTKTENLLTRGIQHGKNTQ